MRENRAAMETLAYAFGRPETTAVFKQQVEDFQVTEDLGFSPDGEGEHCCLQISKRGISTPELVRHLARVSGVPERDIGFAGLKDRQGVCVQWFSIHLPGRENPGTESLEQPGVSVLVATRNSRKIRRGSHRGNHFRILLRSLETDARGTVEARLAQISREGVPNYFGEQRFGVANRNVEDAQRLFSGELVLRRGSRRSMLISAARSHMFNEILSRRVAAGIWHQHLPGDVMNLEGSGSVFQPEGWDETLAERLRTGDIHPTGALWGAGELRTGGEARALEESVAAQYSALCQGLEKAGLKQERRTLRLLVKNLAWQFQQGNLLELSFSLPPGSYATTVLREVCRVKEASGK